MKEEIQNPFPDNNCFFCGCNNQKGLKLKFYWDKSRNEAYAEYLPAKHFVGQGKILHGGIQMGLLDEIMGWTSYAVTQEMAVTTGLNINFLQPVYTCGEAITITCHVTSQKGAKVFMQASLSNSNAEICTIAKGTFHRLPDHKYKKLIKTI
ncbi:MAG: PaaI family thioesterase [Desulfocapsa sp.]|nr:PaaI family thioesterase [Desulfocapsa sp.]